jgi:hypothetical protein
MLHQGHIAYSGGQSATCSPMLRCTDTWWNTRIAYPIRIRYGYASDTRWIRIRGVSDFYYFRKKTDTRADTYPNHGHGASALLDTAQPNKHRISCRPSLDAGSPRIPARPPPARRAICSAGTSACRPPTTGDEPPLASDEHPSLLAGAEDRPCSPVEFPRPCDVDPALPVSKSPSPFSISSSWSRSRLLLDFFAPQSPLHLPLPILDLFYFSRVSEFLLLVCICSRWLLPIWVVLVQVIA